MPWTADRYPVSMRHLQPWIRLKAIKIANALLDEGMEEGRAIRIAIAEAKGVGSAADGTRVARG